ncbi:hypothetical protein Halru_1665 [Halovivax ruber XH-70]|uniref:DUF7344 domain-containing protein n=1 Tax=Halovivax ruber (strain DSM 18193 / JCM 13892 / XH-70) TaxID=797302 RepID=L0IDG9_HALRX|nr:hypothetical protein [Halovivax ruber]AGB16271.1 hypothetical protein Halru_1665 [Halovivax ruber XH-70]
MTQAYPHPTIELTDQRDLTDSERYRLLSSERRRRVLAILANRPGPVSCDELATMLVAEMGGNEATDETHREVTISLHHTHLPMLDDLGVVTYDPTANVVVHESH